MALWIPARPAQHWVERQGPVTPSAAGLVRSNPLLSVTRFGATTRTRFEPRPTWQVSRRGSGKNRRRSWGNATAKGPAAQDLAPLLPLDPDAQYADPERWLGALRIGAPSRFMTASPLGFSKTYSQSVASFCTDNTAITCEGPSPSARTSSGSLHCYPARCDLCRKGSSRAARTARTP